MKDLFVITSISIFKFVRTRFSVFAILLSLVIFTSFVYKSYLAIDPDFGWRLRSGFLIMTEGIQRKDPFSYTMPGFPWVDHAWPVTFFISFVYPVVGKIGLSFVSAGLAFLALLITFTAAKDASYFAKMFVRKKIGIFDSLVFFPSLLAFANFLPFIGVRAQVVSWFMFAVLSLFLFNEKIWNRWRFVLPLQFVIWGNLHGSFSAGLSAVVIYFVFKVVRERRVDIKDALVVFLSVGATLINPYGLGTWREVWSSVSDAKLRWRIIEWQPPFFRFDLSFVTLHTLSFVMIYRFRKKFRLEEMALYFFFLLQGMMSVRNIPLLVIVEMPLVAKAIKEFYLSVESVKQASQRFNVAYLSMWLGSFIVLLVQIILVTLGAEKLSEESFYPREAVSYIKTNLPEGQIISEYSWGGYLIWKLPEKKVFIDGRMPSWKWDSDVPGGSNNAMQELIDLKGGKVSRDEIFDKYNIEMVLWPKQNKRGLDVKLEEKLGNFLKPLGVNLPEYEFIEDVENSKWLNVYEDSVAVIYTKPR